MSFKEKAVSWRQEVHIGKTKPRLIKAAILLLCFGVLIGMAWYYSEFSAKDCAILAGICVLTLAIYMIDASASSDPHSICTCHPVRLFLHI